jgi:hypothetical protein
MPARFESPPEGGLGRSEYGRGVLCDPLGQFLRLRPQLFGRIDYLAHHVQRVSPSGRDSLGPAYERHADDRLSRHFEQQADRFVGAYLPDAHMRIGERGVAGGDHHVGVGGVSRSLLIIPRRSHC